MLSDGVLPGASRWDPQSWLQFPLGPRLVEACGIGAGNVVLDVAAGTGNASIPAVKAGAQVTASDLTDDAVARQRGC
jgi:2-polyprenyl-3-methyl-5-hydroxy-6-metoxy-1,4-benzoquinol methylase